MSFVLKVPWLFEEPLLVAFPETMSSGRSRGLQAVNESVPSPIGSDKMLLLPRS
jgi:hypothetical protein